MIEQTAYVGPLKFEIRYEDACESLQFPQMFERKTDCRHKTYQVRMMTSTDIRPGKDPVFVSKSVEEACSERKLIRSSFYVVDGKKYYYAQSILEKDQIRVLVDVRPGHSFGRYLYIWQFLFLEQLLNRENAVILHSASVIWRGKAILFSAPSGTGKSTQADLWKQYEGAEGLNGDRNILHWSGKSWCVCGLPWHGTSPDCISREVPLGAIAIVRQAPRNSIDQLSSLKKFQYISSELSSIGWDRDFTDRMCDLVENLVGQIPIVQLNCDISRDAVDCLKSHLK